MSDIETEKSPHIGQSRSNVGLERIDLGGKELTRIYNEANGLDPKQHNPITTERIFAAMRAAMATEREACAKICERLLTGGIEAYAQAIRARSNVK